MQDCATSEIRVVEDLFFAALELSATEQAALLANQPGPIRREVEALLLEDQRGPVIKRAVRAAASSMFENGAAPAKPAVQPGERVGAYEIREEIGSGGMGSVYRAVRADEAYHRQVAIKFVRREFDTALFRERFQRERRILGRLDHPYIARLLDAGSTGTGQPYFVMEYVAGAQSITGYARTASLSRNARLELFIKACEAVQYAHQNLTVHRDLKPGNILIDETGTPKLLDFGIAKLTGAEAGSNDHTVAAGLRMLTPGYASPEQAAGLLVTTTADIYSLGAVLYELLLDQQPPQLPEDRDEIDPPSSLGADLGGILRMAMHRDPARRYATANDLRDDLLRHLQGKPIRARSYHWVERMGYFVRSYRTFLLVSVLVTGCLTTAAVFAVHSAQTAELARKEAVRQRNLAETSRLEAEAHSAESARQRLKAEEERNIARLRSQDTFNLTSQLIRDPQDKIEGLPGAGPARLESINIAIQYLERLLKDRDAPPQAWRDLALAFMRLGDLRGGPASTNNQGDTQAALALFDKADVILLRADLRDSADSQAMRVRLLARQADLRDRAGDLAGSGRSIAEGLRVGRLLAKNFDRSAGLPLSELLTIAAQNAIRELDFDKALEYANECRQAVGRAPQSPAVLDLMSSCIVIDGRSRGGKGEYQEAIPLLRQGIAMREDYLRQQPSNNVSRKSLMFAYSHLSAFLGSPSRPSAGDLTGALEAMAKVREHAIWNAQSDPADLSAQKDLGISASRYADLLFAAKKPEQAAAQFSEATAILTSILRRLPGDTHLAGETVFAWKRLGDSWSAFPGHQSEAMSAYRKGLAASEEMERGKALSVSGYLIAAQLHSRFAEVLAPQSPQEVEAHLERSFELIRSAIAIHPAANKTLLNRQKLLLTAAAEVYERLGKPERAEQCRRSAASL